MSISKCEYFHRLCERQRKVASAIIVKFEFKKKIKCLWECCVEYSFDFSCDASCGNVFISLFVVSKCLAFFPASFCRYFNCVNSVMYHVGMRPIDVYETYRSIEIVDREIEIENSQNSQEMRREGILNDMPCQTVSIIRSFHQLHSHSSTKKMLNFDTLLIKNGIQWSSVKRLYFNHWNAMEF